MQYILFFVSARTNKRHHHHRRDSLQEKERGVFKTHGAWHSS
jgi:hypothetical protein